MNKSYLVAEEAAAYLNISRGRFFDFRRFIPSFPKPKRMRLSGSRPRLVWTHEQLDVFAKDFLGGRNHD